MTIRRNLLAAGLLFGSALHAQQINLSLHATAVPDSFEVRATSTGPVFDFLPNAVLTLRWELSSGGVANNSDVRRSCGAYTFLNYGGTVDIGHYRYFSLVLLGDRNLSAAGCAITTTGMSLGGVRIRQLSGCRNVALVQNAYTGMNNLDYFFSIGGVNVTGVITSAPISAGDCPPCEPPVIATIGAGAVDNCIAGVDLWATAGGSFPEFAWYDPDGDLKGWLPETHLVNGSPGIYTLIVSNVCGADTAYAEAMLTPVPCAPPVISNVWYQGLANGFDLHIAVGSSCPGRKWILPNGEVLPVGIGGVVHRDSLADGVYRAVAINACGSDTVELEINDPQGCTGPTILAATISSSGACQNGPTQFNATASGPPGTISTAWYSPTGTLLSSSAQFTVPYAVAGNYMFRAWNACDADTVFVFHGPVDTTGLGACLPPEIISVTGATAACLNDTIHLVPTFTNAGLCAQTTWTNITVLSTQGDTITAVASSTYPVRLTLTNACGQATMEVPIEVWYSAQLVHKLCRPVTAPLDLDSMLHTAFAYTGGQWYLNGQLHGPFYDPAVDTSGTYYYHLSNEVGVACAVVEMIVIEYRPDYGGLDTTITVCSSDPPFALFPMMAGSPHPGGHWSYAGSSVPGQFVPGSSPPGVYRYGIQSMLSGGGCYYYSDMTINVDSALLWYADIDDDGLGDPLDSVLSCDPVDGYVLVAGDACPQVPGTVGDPCDDGDPATQADVITEACVCSGAVGIGMAELQGGALLLWPNPNRGDVFHLRTASPSGVVRITITDATGRVVRQVRMPAAAEPLEVRMPSGTAAGTYFVGVVDDIGSAVLRLVVE